MIDDAAGRQLKGCQRRGREREKRRRENIIKKGRVTAKTRVRVKSGARGAQSRRNLKSAKELSTVTPAPLPPCFSPLLARLSLSLPSTYRAS